VISAEEPSITKMKPSIFITAMTLAGMSALGQAPSGMFQYEFSTSSGVLLWNFSGTYRAPYYLSTNDTLQLSQDGRGGIVGTYLGTYQTENQSSDYVVGTQGSVRGVGTNISVRLSSSFFLAETSVSFFEEIGVRRQDRLLLVFDPATKTLTGTDRVTNTRQDVVSSPDYFHSSHTKNLGSFTYTQAAALVVPAKSDGSWILKLDIAAAGTKLSGTGSILFSNGDTLEFQLTGSYSPTKQTSKVLLLGSGTAKGARLILSMAEPEGNILSMRGTVAGQKLTLP